MSTDHEIFMNGVPGFFPDGDQYFFAVQYESGGAVEFLTEDASTRSEVIAQFESDTGVDRFSEGGLLVTELEAAQYEAVVELNQRARRQATEYVDSVRNGTERAVNASLLLPGRFPVRAYVQRRGSVLELAIERDFEPGPETQLVGVAILGDEDENKFASEIIDEIGRDNVEQRVNETPVPF